ncbi:MAG: TIGR03118 family protein [Candidatus Sulfotelmatobacter sp.]
MQRRTATFALTLGLALMFASSAAIAQYKITNLVSNQTGQAKHDDPLLVNAWGLARSAGSPFWISDNGTGWSTIYTGAGVKQGLEVSIPSANGKGTGQPTGIVFNGSGEFAVGGNTPFFIFATFDGAIAGWAPSSNPNAAIIAVNNSSSLAQYTGLAITNHASGNFLYAADAWNNKVDIYDGNWNWVSSFTDPTIPAGYAPFGIQDIDGLLFVSFVAQSGAPGGVIDIYSEDGTWLKQLTQGPPLNQPWGFAAAPKNFGPLSNTLLVGNDNGGTSTINAFNVLTGQFVGTIKDSTGKAIEIDQLWGLEFGGGTAKNGAANQLFFTAGPNSSLAGTFGVISYAP